MKCEECKAFSRQSEIGGTCHFTDFGTVMNEDGKNCRSGRIVDSIYRRGRADERERIVAILKENSYEVDIDCPPYQETIVSLTDILEVLAESEIVRGG